MVGVFGPPRRCLASQGGWAARSGAGWARIGPEAGPASTASGSRRSRACSSSSISASRFAPSFMFWILSCSLTIESSSISGRGGQPGR